MSDTDNSDRQIVISDIGTAVDSSPTSNEPVNHAEYNKLREQFARVSDEKFALKEELDRLQKRVRTGEILDELIKPYANKAFLFMVGYAVAALGILIADGAKFKEFDLPDSVLELLVGSTAVTVIGLVGMVLTGIFVGARKAGA